jgi:hypothetical protein
MSSSLHIITVLKSRRISWADYVERMVRLQIVLTVFMKSIDFWNVISCSLHSTRGFGGTFRLYLQDRKLSQARNSWDLKRRVHYTVLQHNRGQFQR